jgi:hypothetical protein
METPMYIQQEMKFTLRKLPAEPGAPSAPCLDEETKLSPVTHVPFVCAINFFEERGGLPAGLEKSRQEFATNRVAPKVAARRLHSSRRIDRLEESLYWLLSAATLVYLLLGIIAR